MDFLDGGVDRVVDGVFGVAVTTPPLDGLRVDRVLGLLEVKPACFSKAACFSAR